MKNFTGKLALAAAVIALTLSLPFFTNGQAFAQEEDAPPPPGDVRPGDGTPPNGGDLIRRLNLTPEQIRQIREIRQSNAEEWLRSRQRLNRAQRALDGAIYADSVSEADVEARAREVAAAQTDFVRLRALTELRIRRLLTTEQLNRLRAIRAEAVERNREQRQRERRANPNAYQQRRRPNLTGPSDGNVRPGAIQPQQPPAATRPRRP